MLATILCYHKVGPELEEGRRLNIDPHRLKSHVRYFARSGYAFKRAFELGDRWTPKTVCFTFDDAYASTLHYGMAIFDDLERPMTLYAVTERVGQTSTWDGELARPLADWPELRAAAERGHEIGNHSATHPNFSKLSRDEQVREIAAADAKLRSEGLPPRSFCFPYGGLSGASPEVLSQTGYAVGLGLGKRLTKATDDRRTLPRVVVAYSDALPLLIYRVNFRARLRSMRG